MTGMSAIRILTMTWATMMVMTTVMMRGTMADKGRWLVPRITSEGPRFAGLLLRKKST